MFVQAWRLNTDLLSTTMRAETAQNSSMCKLTTRVSIVVPQAGFDAGWEQLPACISEVLPLSWLLCVSLQLRND